MIPTWDESMRRFAHEAVDALFDHVQNVERRPVVDWHSADELRQLVRVGEEGRGDELELLTANAIQLHHPRYMGHQVCPPFPTAAIADLVISALNQSTAVWEMSPIGTVIEQEIVRWLADRAGLPAESAGTAVSGGSAANLTGLLAARARSNSAHRRSRERPGARESGVGSRGSKRDSSPTRYSRPPTPISRSSARVQPAAR